MSNTSDLYRPVYRWCQSSGFQGWGFIFQDMCFWSPCIQHLAIPSYDGESIIGDFECGSLHFKIICWMSHTDEASRSEIEVRRLSVLNESTTPFRRISPRLNDHFWVWIGLSGPCPHWNRNHEEVHQFCFRSVFTGTNNSEFGRIVAKAYVRETITENDRGNFWIFLTVGNFENIVPNVGKGRLQTCQFSTNL